MKKIGFQGVALGGWPSPEHVFYVGEPTGPLALLLLGSLSLSRSDCECSSYISPITMIDATNELKLKGACLSMPMLASISLGARGSSLRSALSIRFH